jgi:Uri superfamily endonuclease
MLGESVNIKMILRIQIKVVSAITERQNIRFHVDFFSDKMSGCKVISKNMIETQIYSGFIECVRRIKEIAMNSALPLALHLNEPGWFFFLKQQTYIISS